MTSTNDSGLGHGTVGVPQKSLYEEIYQIQENENEDVNLDNSPKYDPSPKHAKGGWGSDNPIQTNEEGQELLDTGYVDGKQIFNITKNGDIVKFQPDNTPNNGFHSYGVTKPRDIPPNILKKMLSDNRITRAEYNKFRKGKK